MRSFGAWFGRLALAGGCLAWAGCGGGSVPDPDSDANAASDAPARVVDRGAVAPEAPAIVAPAPAEAPAPVAAAAPAEAERPAPAPAPAAVAAAPAPAEAEKSAPAVKGDASGTEDMLRIASTPAQPPAASAETSAPAGNPAGGFGTKGLEREGMTPGGPSPAGYPGAPGGNAANGYPGAPGAPGGAPAPGAPGGRDGSPSGALAGEPGGPGMRGAAGGPGEFSGMMGPGGTGNPNDSAAVGPETFKHPATAVQAFLNALQAKNKDRLTQATARRAPTEAEEKHRKIFAEIVDGSISDDELDEMSKAMAGFQLFQLLPAKSTGRIGVVVSKMEGRERMQRTITVRKESDGWKVMDISSMLEFKAGLPPIFTRGYRGRRR